MRCAICSSLQIAGSSYCPHCKVMSDRIDYLLEHCPDRLFPYIEAIYLITKAKLEINDERVKNREGCRSSEVSK
jgi:hypothetical protein